MTAVTETPPPYGDQPPQNPYGGQPPQLGYGYGGYAPVDHPQATTVLVLGIVSMVVCGVAGPFAWIMGNRVVREIDASGGRWGGRSTANIGRILGIVASVFLGLLVVFFVGVAIFVIAVGATASTSP
jgi:uncharacterized membrane protein YjgN (DUF898 family)